jgi:membrane fusion protein (multidrug efflux system)
MVVTSDNKVEARTIKISSAYEDRWIVSEGLNAGDQVIVEGLQKIRPGASVKPIPFNSAISEVSSSPQGK